MEGVQSVSWTALLSSFGDESEESKVNVNSMPVVQGNDMQDEDILKELLSTPPIRSSDPIQLTSGPMPLASGLSDESNMDNNRALCLPGDQNYSSISAPLIKIENSDDILRVACCISGIDESPPPENIGPSISSTGFEQTISNNPEIYFQVQPDNVQFRYETEVKKSNTSPLHGKGRDWKFPMIKVRNLNPSVTYVVEVTLVDEQCQPSIHKLYITKDNGRGVLSPSCNGSVELAYQRHVPQQQKSFEISVENVGIQRQVTRGDGNCRSKKGAKETQDSVMLRAVLSTIAECNGHRVVNPINECYSDAIHDIKKVNLKIVHMNPTVGFESGRQEVTILCTKIKDDTEVHFKIRENILSAQICQRHHGVALVALAPPIPIDPCDSWESISAEVALYCPKTKRYGESVQFLYKKDPLTPFFHSRRRDRSRSPIPRDTIPQYLPLGGQRYIEVFEAQGGVEPDGTPIHDQDDEILSKMKDLKIDSKSDDRCWLKGTIQPTSLEERRHRATPSKMSELTIVRETACGKRRWNEEVRNIVIKSPFTLHVQDSNGMTPLAEALGVGAHDVFKSFLESVDEDHRRQLLTSRLPSGMTLLHAIAIPERLPVSVVEYMMENGSDPLAVDKSGRTVIHLLVQKGRVILLEAFLKCVRRWIQNKGDGACGLKTFLNRIDDEGRGALHTAVIFGVVSAIDILIKYGADINLLCPHNGYSALHWGVVVNDSEAVNLLLARGAKVRRKSKRGKTVFHLIEETLCSSLIKDALESKRKGSCSDESQESLSAD